MKKVGFSILLILALCLLLSSCSSKQESVIVKAKDFKPILGEIAANSEIVLFNNQKLYYFTDEVNEKTPDLANKSLYEYDFEKNKTALIDTFDDISISSNSKAIYQNGFYMHLATNDQNNLIKVDTDKLSTEVIKKWDAFPPLAYIYSMKNYLILFGLDSKESETKYYVNKINLTNNKEENIITKSILNQKGELISCIDVDKNYVYAFSILATGEDEAYRIIKYDLDGKEYAVYPFDLESFLPIKTLMSEDDAIISIHKEKDYFILNTINGRVFIFKTDNDKVQPIEMPEKFYKDNPAGYHFLEYYDGDSNYAYFINTFGQNNIVEVFDYLTESFTSFELPKEDNSSYVYYRDADGNLIIKKSNNVNINQAQYYYINSPIISQ